MYLIEKKTQLLSPFRGFSKKSANSNGNFDLIARSFDENVLRRLKSLNLDHSSSNFSLLVRAVDFLTSTHAEAQNLISNLRSEPDVLSLELYMSHSVKLLDICNSVSSRIDQMRQHRLLIKFILQLLKVSEESDSQISPSPEKIKKARDSLNTDDLLVNFTAKNDRFGSGARPEVLIGELAAALGDPPRGKINTARNLIRRTIYAVGVITVFVSGLLASVLLGAPDDCGVTKVRVPAEFLWADSFNDLQSSIFDRIKQRPRRCVDEIDEVVTRAVGVRGALDDVVLKGNDKDLAPLVRVVGEFGTATEKFSEGLERLADVVKGMFDTVLSARNGVLDNFRLK